MDPKDEISKIANKFSKRTHWFNMRGLNNEHKKTFRLAV